MSTDLCAAALLKDLAALDDLPPDFNAAERRALVSSAQETLRWLVAAGGGPFESDVLARIGRALDGAAEGTS